MNLDIEKIKKQELEIKTNEDYKKGGELLQQVKELKNEIEKSYKPIIEKAHQAHKEALAQLKEKIKPVEEVEKIIKQNMSRFYEEQEKIRIREEQEKYRIERERQEAINKELARLENLKTEKAKQNSKEKIEVLETELKEVIEAPVIETQKIEGVSYRDNWKFEIINPSLIPREFLIPDDKKIGAYVRSLKDSATIPGVKIWNEKTLVSR